ncbi:chorismate-binding protein [Lutibacter sp. TH_r2]|uniref:chorismate-binding protein n=1 Tax=Lutibacter sp. TH_r2 TaxID=3082083 RepID=UPI002953F3CC|nr:chorismate-binding protein [Lutibacter sp. TH_r2]MDV7187340.1 chorismate-binding protein [Lutibacter sp. TH_r2]
MYRNINEVEVFGLLQNTDNLISLDSFNSKGFVFCPFTNSENSYIISLNNSSKISTVVEDSNFEYLNSNFSVLSSSLEKKEYENLIESTVKHINKTKIEKIVISRKENVEVANMDVIKTFINMLHKYKNAFVYCWFHPKTGLWMGASPERLIQIDKGVFKTMSLASTQNYEGSLNVNWGTKELEEQKIVTDYILDNLKPILSTIKTVGPYTVKAGSLLHLKTDITSKVVSENTVEQLIHKLHPTPAVCGMPKENAKEFILNNEQYNRKYYTGFLGELNINSSTNLFVNLRCMEVNTNVVSIYIGGGITASSIPSKEWNETVFKSNVMKTIL